jgi:hypothetical protein
MYMGVCPNPRYDRMGIRSNITVNKLRVDEGVGIAE